MTRTNSPLILAGLFGFLGLVNLALLDFVLWPNYLAPRAEANSGASTPTPDAAQKPARPDAGATTRARPHPAKRPPGRAVDSAAPMESKEKIPNKYKGLLNNPPDVVVLFSVNRTDLSARARRKLVQFVQQQRHATTRFLIVGHTDGRGDEGYNELLGLQRALAVALELSRLGVPKLRILDPVSQGSSTPAAAGAGARQRANNRRVEVYVAR